LVDERLQRSIECLVQVDFAKLQCKI
jgi:hypothetical protein